MSTPYTFRDVTAGTNQISGHIKGIQTDTMQIKKKYRNDSNLFTFVDFYDF